MSSKKQNLVTKIQDTVRLMQPCEQNAALCFIGATIVSVLGLASLVRGKYTKTVLFGTSSGLLLHQTISLLGQSKAIPEAREVNLHGVGENNRYARVHDEDEQYLARIVGDDVFNHRSSKTVGYFKLGKILIKRITRSRNRIVEHRTKRIGYIVKPKNLSEQTKCQLLRNEL